MITTKEQIDRLLEPRVIVDHIYPGCPFSKGDILKTVPKELSQMNGAFYCNQTHISKLVIDACIHDKANNFRYLKWTEFRKPEEMPKYLKLPNCDIIELTDWSKHDYNCIAYANIIPATELEFHKYQNQKTTR